MKKTYFIYLLIIFCYACNLQPGKYKISGTLKNAEGRTVYLKEMTTEKFIPVDSIKVKKNGTFSLSGFTEEPKFFSLHVTKNNFITLLINPKEKITITGDAIDLTNIYEIEGSKDSKLVRELNIQINKTVLNLKSLGNTYRVQLDSIRNANDNNPGNLEIEIEKLKMEVNQTFDEIIHNQMEFTISFIEKNTSSIASFMALYQQIDPKTYILNSKDDFKYFEMVDSALFERYPESNYVKILHGNVTEIKKRLEIQKWISLGSEIPVPEISLPNPEGDTISLSSFRGQYVLLDFWASWCTPCRIENPNLVSNYKKYHNKGFEIFQVSLDKSKDNWLKAIKNDQLDWIHVSDLQFWNSVVVPLYNIQSIPANFLLDKEGNIISKNLRGSQLGEKLSEILD